MIVAFGRYPQDVQNESGLFVPEPLLWRVLEVDEKQKRALLITERLIDCRGYHERWEDITWGKCTLRQWMNDDFIRQAFTAEEASLILRVWNENPGHYRRGMRGIDMYVDDGNATWDRVFALSLDEVRRKDYFSNPNARTASMTLYAKQKTSDGYYTGWWWLRSPGIHSNYAACVLTYGDVAYEYGYSVDYSGASVRPALWLNLESEIF